MNSQQQKIYNEINKFVPSCEQESKEKEVILKYVEMFPNILIRENEFAHITSSGWIINKTHDKTLMAYHKIYDSWTWTGGHADGDDDFVAIAIREAEEETGIHAKLISPEILSLDIIPVLGHIKNGKYVATHMHLSLCYLLEADENEPIRPKLDENTGVKWVPFSEVLTTISEPMMKPIFQKIMNKVEKITSPLKK